MKRIIILITAAVLLLTSTGCTSSAAKKAMEETRLAISNGEYQEALTYAKLAVKEGAKDEEFLSLVAIVEGFQAAHEALEDIDIDTAENLLSKINDFEGSGMTVVLKSLQKDIDDAKAAAEAYDKNIADIEQKIEKGYVYSASSEARSLLEKDDLTKKQREKVQELKNTADAGKESSSSSSAKSSTSTTAPAAATSGGGKAMLTESEAIDLVRKAKNFPSDSRITATLISDYYQINVRATYIVDGEKIEDEFACKVNALTGEIFGEAG